MRSGIKGLIVPALLALSLSPAFAANHNTEKPASASEIRKEFNDTVEALKRYSDEQRDEFAAAAEKALADMEGRINALEDRIDDTYGNVRDETRQEWKESLRELRRKRSELAVWYGGVKEGSAEAWPRLKQGFRDAYEDIANAYHDAVDSFGEKSDRKRQEK